MISSLEGKTVSLNVTIEEKERMTDNIKSDQNRSEPHVMAGFYIKFGIMKECPTSLTISWPKVQVSSSLVNERSVLEQLPVVLRTKKRLFPEACGS